MTLRWLLCCFSPLMVIMVNARCPDVPCERGKSCDYNTGICRRFRIPEGFQRLQFAEPIDVWNKCEHVRCPPGHNCDGHSGVCVRTAAQRPSRLQINDFANEYCENVHCPPEHVCVGGKCIRNYTKSDILLICQNVSCPRGYECTPPDGVCRKLTQIHSDLTDVPPLIQRFPARNFDDPIPEAKLTCPVNSHFVECGSPCTFTCTDVHPKCKSEQHDCIRTCVCDDGYVQMNALNTTCVPAIECRNVALEETDKCLDLQCSIGMRCVAGHCNPEHCPPVVKPSISDGCDHVAIVRDRRNCIVLLNECDLAS